MQSKDYPKILAKWRNKVGNPDEWVFPIGETLSDHTDSVVSFAEFFLTDPQASVGSSLYEKMHLKDLVSYGEFRRLVLLASLLHDVGKANKEFQKMLWALEETWVKNKYTLNARDLNRKLQDERKHQAFRHEEAGILLLTRKDFWGWLEKEAGKHCHEVLWAIYGHHLKTKKQHKIVDEMDPADAKEIKLVLYVEDVVDCIRNVVGHHLLPFSIPKVNGSRIDRCYIEERKFLDEYKGKKRETRLSMAIKLMVILSDSFGSMSPDKGWKEGHSAFTSWLKDALRESLKLGRVNLKDSIDKKVFDSPYPHQTQALFTTGDILIDVACGGGKTATGFLSAIDNPDLTSSERIILTENVRMAAFQLFRDLGVKNGVTNEGVGLRFSTAATDMMLLGCYDEDGASEDALGIVDVWRTLKEYTKTISYATVDQVLGIMAFRRKSLMWLPLILKSTIIFDEFHSYDEYTQDNFQDFLSFFPGIRVIVMSGTITPRQESDFKALRPASTVIHSAGGADDLANYQRYCFHFINESDAPTYFSAIARTLWVVNRVKAAQSVGRAFPDAKVLHSRFRHRERILNGEALVQGFRSQNEIRAVATQVAQTSLDISGDRGIFEICPRDEFVQRLGRTGGRGKVPDKLTDIYFYMPETSLPYEDLEVLTSWYEKLTQKPSWSFRELVEYFKDSVPNEERKPPEPRFMKETYPRLVRRSDGKETLLMGQDIPEIQARLQKGENLRVIQEYELTDFPNWKSSAGLFYGRVVVPDYYVYDTRLGAVKLKDILP